MGTRFVAKAILGTLLLGAPVAGIAQAGWVPGSEITGQSVQVMTNGTTNTVYLDAGGQARIQTPGGNTVPATWSAAGGQLCLSTGAARECWRYARPFQAGQHVTLTSSCIAASQWTALGTNMTPPPAQGSGERG
jgi:hypothetical protein